MNARSKHVQATQSLDQLIFEGIADLPIVSPHGHCDPTWFAKDTAFPDPARLLITPDHYLLRMLYSQGVPLEEMALGKAPRVTDSREVFRRFAAHWDAFLGTPTRLWMEHILYKTLKIDTHLSAGSADAVHDEIAEAISRPEWRPRAAFDALNIEVLATTGAALDPLSAHRDLQSSEWSGRVVPTFRPDDILDPARPGHSLRLARLAELTGEDTADFAGFLAAIRKRRAHFKSLGATATDHDVPLLKTEHLSGREIAELHARAVRAALTAAEATRYYGHMLTVMAEMSVEDGLVMQLHVGCQRSTNAAVLARFGPDMGADIPGKADWVSGLSALLNRVGNSNDLTVVLFTLDESSYSRELAPMVGHWPCLKLGPPWWFHDSPNGIRRYFDLVVESAGYQNLAGFNDDTRAFLSIPARHAVWRMGVSQHLAGQVEVGRFGLEDAHWLARQLSTELARKTYRLETELPA